MTTAKHKHTEKNIMEVLDRVDKSINKTTSNDVMLNNYVNDNKGDNKSDKPELTEQENTKVVDITIERGRLLAEILKIDGITAKECQTYTSIKFKGKCLMEVYKGKKKFQVAVADKYVDNEIKSLGKLTNQKFHNNLYITITPESNFNFIYKGLIQAVKRIINEMSQQIKLKEVALDK